MTAAMTQAEYARHANVNRSQITRWLRAGRITALPSGLIDPDTADAQRAASESPLPHHQARKDQIDEQKAGGSPAPSPPANLDKSAEAALYMRRKRELLDLDLDQKARLLVDRAEFDLVAAEFAATARLIHERFPERWSHAWAALGVPADKAARLLEEMGRDSSLELSENMGRKLGELDAA